MAQSASATLSCSLEARDFTERVAWIASLNNKWLRHYRRRGASLILIYASEARNEVEGMIAREQKCCAFLEFNLRAMNGTTELTITVPEGQEANAGGLLAPFHDSQASTDASSCCGVCQA